MSTKPMADSDRLVINAQRTSVVVPVYNSERFLMDTVRSVYEQTIVPGEVILVNDGSTDGTPRVLDELRRQYPLTVITKANGGEASARNAGIEAAQGEFLAFLDHDDRWLPRKLERQLDQLEADLSLAMSFTGLTLARPDHAGPVLLESWDPDPAAALQRQLEGACVGTTSVVVVRREALAELRFDEQVRPYGCDWLMWLELAARGVGIGYIPEPLVTYRQHTTNLNYTAPYPVVGREVIDRFFARNPNVGHSRYWRAHWRLLAAEAHDGRRNLLQAAVIRPASIRPGWLRLLVGI
jgi:teichuronic acid biosynthesis glycosyltransferase TuaG